MHTDTNYFYMIRLKKTTIWIIAPVVVWASLNSQNSAEAYSRKKKETKTEVVTEVKVEEKNAKPAATPSVQELLPLDPNVVHGTLPNGMQYFIRKNSKPENRMELRLAVNAGSIQEDDDQKGLAHFLEHMAFNGSKNFEKNDLINYVETMGIKFGPHLNAYTSFDETVYMLQLPTDQSETVDKGLLILEDWANGLTLSKEEVDKEKGVVISEWRSSLGPMQRMQYQFFPVLFNGSRYPERLPIGDTAIIKNASQEVVKRFYQDWYRPDLMAIIIVGDIDPKSMEQEIIKRFSDIPPVKSPRKKEIYPVPPHQEALVSIVTDKEAPYTQIYLFEKHPAKENNTIIGYRDYIKQQLINTMLNERYKEILQQPAPPFFYAASNYGGQLRNLDAFLSVAIGSSDKTESMLQTLFEETYRASRYGFNASELNRAFAEVKSSYEAALNEKDKTESANYANEYVDYYLTQKATPGIEMEYQLLQIFEPTITLDEINSTVKNLITHNNTVIVVTAPEKDAALLPSRERILELQNEIANSELAQVEEKEVAAELIAELPTAGKIIKKEKNDAYNVEKWTLNNGATVYVKPTDFKNDEILVHAFSKGGSSLYADADFFSISNAAPLVAESGYGAFDAVSLNRTLAGKNVKSSPYISELEEGISANAAPKDVETLFQLIHLNFTAPRKDSLIYQSYIAKNKALFSNLLANPMFYFQKASLETLYNKNIRKSFPALEDFDKINFSKAISFYQERFNNAGDFNFVIVGNIDSEQLSSLVEQYIASLPATGKKESWKDNKTGIAKGKINKDIQMGAAPKTNVLFNYNGTKAWSKDNELVYEMLRDALNIKLRESLREDKGGVYGVGVNGEFQRIPTPEYYTIINYNAEPENAANLEKEALKVIENLKTNGIDEATLNKVKEKIRREIETELKENSYWISAIKSSVAFEEPITNANEYLKKVQAITPAQIQAAAQEYLKGDNFIRIVMTPTAE